MTYNAKETRQALHSLLRSAGVSDEDIKCAESRSRLACESWQQEHEKEVAEIERATNERIKQTNMRLDMQFEMIHVNERMRIDEMLAGASDDYKRGFYDAYRLQAEVADAIDKA